MNFKLSKRTLLFAVALFALPVTVIVPMQEKQVQKSRWERVKQGWDNNSYGCKYVAAGALFVSGLLVGGYLLGPKLILNWNINKIFTLDQIEELKEKMGKDYSDFAAKGIMTLPDGRKGTFETLFLELYPDMMSTFKRMPSLQKIVFKGLVIMNQIVPQYNLDFNFQ